MRVSLLFSGFFVPRYLDTRYPFFSFGRYIPHQATKENQSSEIESHQASHEVVSPSHAHMTVEN